MELDQLLAYAVEQSASDVHVKVGSRPRLRVDGRLREAPFDTVEPADTERIAAAIIPRHRQDAFRELNEADFMYGIAGLGRFRVSASASGAGSGWCCAGCSPASRASTPCSCLTRS